MNSFKLSICNFIALVAVFSCNKIEINSENIEIIPTSAESLSLTRIDRASTTLSPDEAICVSSIFKSSIPTKSSDFLIRNVVAIKDDHDNPAIYAVNHGNGYTLVSATKDYFPILAEVEKGEFSFLDYSSPESILIGQYLDDIKLIKDHPELKVDRNLWVKYENQSYGLVSPRTKVNSHYYDILDEYLEIWNDRGLNVYYLFNQPDGMPDDLYAQFCSIAEDEMGDSDEYPFMQCAIITEESHEESESIGPLLSTEWDQFSPYNAMVPNNLPLGCVTVAVGQIMRYLEYPTYFNWSNMPNSSSNYYLSYFLATLRADLNVSPSGGSSIYNAKSTLEGYGYNCTIYNHNGSPVTSSLQSSKPVYMRGHDSYHDTSHAWVCDGYRYAIPSRTYTLYVLMYEDGYEPSYFGEAASDTVYDSYPFFFHMNWGWGGSKNGYFQDNNIYISNFDGNDYRNYNTDRKDLIINYY